MSYTHKCYRVEWVVQIGETDQYGITFTPQRETPFSTKEEADAELSRVAHPHPYVDGRMIPNDAEHDYMRARVRYREVHVSTVRGLR